MGLRAVSYCAESVFCILNFEYLSENQTKNETILIHWSVDQAGLNDEKTGGRKSCWTVPLTRGILRSWESSMVHVLSCIDNCACPCAFYLFYLTLTRRILRSCESSMVHVLSSTRTVPHRRPLKNKISFNEERLTLPARKKFRKGGIHTRRYAGQEGCRNRGMQERRDTGKAGCMRGGIQKRRDTGKEV